MRPRCGRVCLLLWWQSRPHQTLLHCWFLLQICGVLGGECLSALSALSVQLPALAALSVSGRQLYMGVKAHCTLRVACTYGYVGVWATARGTEHCLAASCITTRTMLLRWVLIALHGWFTGCLDPVSSKCMCPAVHLADCMQRVAWRAGQGLQKAALAESSVTCSHS